MTIPVYPIVFFFYAFLLVFAAVLVITLRNPVHAVLCLVLAFFASAVLWMLLQAEFLALVLLFVYVGAVMTLFLFVVMMLNIDLSRTREQFVRFVPIGVIVLVLLVGLLIYAFLPRQFELAKIVPTLHGENYSNVKTMGTLLYTDYLFPFEIAAVILLVAIISAISLTFHGRKPETKAQRMGDQVRVNKKDRLKVIKMPSESL